MKFSFWKFLIILLLLVGGVWLFRYLTTPIPGVAVEDQGREHVGEQEVAKTVYKSNPPASGPHLPTWVKPGIYSEPQSEGELIHSLEHGYVIISYNCGVHLTKEPRTQLSLIKLFAIVMAHEEVGASAGADLAPSRPATGSAITETDGCKNLIKQLTDLVNRKKPWKLIVVPRPQLNTTLALVAWDRIDKFDDFDTERIETFIDYFRDHGPEKTME